MYVQFEAAATDPCYILMYGLFFTILLTATENI